MRAELLAKMADIINMKSTRYHAVVPCACHPYMTQADDHLVKTECHVLKITLVGRTRCPRYRTEWNLFEIDLDKIIRKISCHDQAFSVRMRMCEPTAHDVEMLVRRASYRSLRLGIAPSGFHLDGTDH